MDLATAAGVPDTITLGTLETLFSPLSLGDLAEFEKSANTKTIEDARDRVKFLEGEGVLTPEEKKETLTTAYDSTKNGQASRRQAGTLDGIRLLARLSMRQRQPNITDADICRLVTVANMSRVQEAIDRGVDGTEPPNVGTASADSMPPSPEPTGATPTDPS